MSSSYQEIQATLASPGAKHILNALRAYHKAQWREYRKCKTEVDLAKVQTVQLVIDKIIPDIMETLLNAHIPEHDREKAKKRGEWWWFWEWFTGMVKRAM